MRLVACRACERHLKPEETACPFCGATTRSAAPLVATAVVGMALAAAALACDDDSMQVPVYGAPAIEDAGTTDAGFTDAGS